jgi:hypothetical protein
MKLWMSGEVKSDVADDYRFVRIGLEHAINEFLAIDDYGTGLNEWAYLAIIASDSIAAQYPEIAKYHAKRKVAEFRLVVPHEDFLIGSTIRKRELIIQSLQRSVGMLTSIGVKGADHGRLHAVLESLNSGKQ